MFNFLLDQNAFTSLQSGFVPGDSTVNQHVDVYNTFYKALDGGKEVRAIFATLWIGFGIMAYCTNSNLKESTKYYYSGLLKYCRINKKREKLTLSASFHVIFSRTFRYANRKSCSIF